MSAVVAFDPGRTTGMCVASDINFKTSTFDIPENREIIWSDRYKIFDILAAIHLKHNIIAIVIEKFILYPSAQLKGSLTFDDFPSTHITGMIDYAAHDLALHNKIYFQTAAQRKNVQIVPEHYDLLRKSKHCRDAYMHVRYFIKTHRNGLTDESQAFVI